MQGHYGANSETFAPLVRDNYLVNTFLRGIRDNVTISVGKESSFHTLPDLPILIDVDSFIYLAYQGLPVSGDNFSVYYRPNFDSSIKTDLGVTWSIPSIQNGKNIALSKCPNLLFCSRGDLKVCRKFSMLFNTTVQSYSFANFFVDCYFFPSFVHQISIQCARECGYWRVICCYRGPYTLC
jgi:hypothetical protein